MVIKIKVNEIFHSIQGEGLLQGLPTTFVRLSGCNLNCNYCDSTYASESYLNLTSMEIIDIVNSYECERVCITGGEPLLHSGLVDLVQRLPNNDVSIETNGSLDISPVVGSAKISLDVKCPSSGCSNETYWTNLTLLDQKDQVKFVVGDLNDLTYAKRVISSHNLSSRTNVFIIPVFGIDYQCIVEKLLQSRMPDVRFGMQLHKFVWHPQTRGV